MPRAIPPAAQICLLLAAGCATPNLAPQRADHRETEAAKSSLRTLNPPHEPRPRENLREAAYRTAYLGHQIRTKGVEICRPQDRKGISGFAFWTEGEKSPMFATWVFPESPADKAGLEWGDQIVRIGTTKISNKTSTKKLSKKLDKQTRIAIQEGTAVYLSVLRQGEEQTLEIYPQEGCKYQVALYPNEALNAHADGETVAIYKGIYDITENDSQLLIVIGHEMAHNSVGHIRKKKTNAVIAGIFGALLDIAACYGQASAGQQCSNRATATEAAMALGALAYSKDFEREADYAGLYFAYLAGADIGESTRFWKIMHNAKGGNTNRFHIPEIAFKYRGTHPSDAERQANLQKTILEIIQKAENNQQLRPTTKKEAQEAARAKKQARREARNQYIQNCTQQRGKSRRACKTEWRRISPNHP